MEKDTEFYIGWQNETPPKITQTVRKAVGIIFLSTLIVALVVVLFQQGFSTSKFELGKETTLEGWISATPFPMLNVSFENTPLSNSPIQQLLLLSQGKFGAQKVLSEIEQKLGQSLLNKRVRAVGSLIYHDGKTAFELHDATIIDGNSATPNIPLYKIADTVCLQGEIVDPKCLLGAMKPGYGKPHLDCAARCITGGIPPVLKVANAKGEAEYYLLAGSDGKLINSQILPYVGHGVNVKGRLLQQGNWLIILTDVKTIQHFDKNIFYAPMCQTN
jgi:hypothetical protein